MTRIIYLSWALLVASLLFFGAVYYEAGAIQSAAESRANAASDAERQLDKSAYSQRVHAIATDTKDERDQLDSYAHLDIVSTVQMLEDTGKSAGVTANVTDALPSGDAQDLPGGEKLQTVSFSLLADGTYQNLIRAAMLYEQLPLASHVVQLDIERADAKDAKAPWHMTIRIRITTIAAGL